MNSVETCVGTVEKLLPGGEALVRVDGVSVLVNNAVPGDLLQLKMQGKRRGVLRADIESVMESSAQRVPSACSVAASCGGCALQYISREQQAAEKSSWVRDAFNCVVDEHTTWIPVDAIEQHYRRRVRWFVAQDKQGYFLGFYAPATHQAVRHQSCMVVTEALNAVRLLIEQQLDLEGVASVQAVQLDDGMHVILEADHRPEAMPVEQIDSIDDSIDAPPLQWWWRDENHITRPLQKPVRYFHDVLPAASHAVHLRVGPDDFVQGQREGNRALIRQIQEWAGPVHRIADLFCGIGNLSLPLAAATGAEVFGAELNAASVRAASSNAKSLDVKSQFVVANLFETFDHEPYIAADVLILDPPRRGAKRLCNQMARLLPKKIIMVSCDVASGARDAAILKEQGYRLKVLRGLDLFPFAGHVEAMSLWEQR